MEDGIITERKVFQTTSSTKSRPPTLASRTGEIHGSQRNGPCVGFTRRFDPRAAFAARYASSRRIEQEAD